MNLLLEKGRTARRPSPQLLMTFDEDAHPRAAAGEHGDKYHGGEFVPKDHAESDHPKPPSFFPEKEREADFSKDADPDAEPKEENFSWNYPFTQAEAITYMKLIAVTSPDTKFVMDMDPHGDGYGVWDEESSQDYAHGIDTYSILYNEEEARVQRKKFDKQFGTKRWNAYDKAAELDEFAHRRLRKALHSEPELEEEEKADKPGEPLDKAMSATDHPRAGKGAKGKYHGGQFVPKGQGSKAPAAQGAFDFGGDEDDLVEELEEQGEKGHLDASEPDTEAPEAGEVSEPSDDKERLSRPLTHEEAGAAAHLYGQIRNEEEEKGADEREPGAWEAAHRGLQAAEQGPDALHDHLAAAGEDDPHAERVKEHLGVGSESATEEKPATVTANGKTATITPEICQTVLKDLKQVLKQEEAEDDPKYRSQPVIDAMKQGIAVAEKGPHAIAEFLASANPDDMPAYGMLDSIFPDYNEDHQEHEQQQVKDTKAAEESGIESLMNEPVPEAKAPVEPGQETGPGRRGGRPLKEMGFGGLAKFGFKSVAWGSLSKAAKEFHSHGLAASALDLADVTGLPDEAVGLFGHLAVSVGAGTYRAAGAYYDANKRIFNLGRNNGAGAFAHEWAHALDHSLVAGNPKMKGAQSPFATSYPDAMPPGPTKNAVKALLRTLKGSQFVKDAVKISGHRGTRKGYWHNNQELFARAFEGYVQDKLKDEGRENKYLTDAGDTVNEGWRKAGYEPYTQGEERRLINHRFEQLFRAIRSEQKDVIKAMKRKPAEGQGAFSFDEEAHPRAQEAQGKYKPGEFVPKAESPPWEATKDNLPAGARYVPEIHNTVARYEPDGTITLTNAFFDLPPDLRKNVWAHEKAHGVVADLSSPERALTDFWPLVDSGLLGKYDEEKDRFVGLKNQRNPDEVLADLVADYTLDPEKLRKEFPAQFPIAEKLARGEPVPPELYGKPEPVAADPEPEPPTINPQQMQAEADLAAPWTMTPERYQHLSGVKQPWIAEISPMQYWHISKRAKAQYDAKRTQEWGDSMAIKREWRDKVVAAYQAGTITKQTPDLHPEARDAIGDHERYQAKRQEEAAKKQAHRENDITSMDQINVGDRVFDIMCGQYGTIVKKNRLSCLLQVENPPAWLKKPIKTAPGQIQWKQYNDVEVKKSVALLLKVEP